MSADGFGGIDVVAEHIVDKSERDSTKKKRNWKKPFLIIVSLIGIVASTSTVVGLIRGWFDPEPTLEDTVSQLEKIQEKLDAKNEDSHLVNQVSRRITELSDQFSVIDSKMAQIRSLAKSLNEQSSQGKILMPEQKQLLSSASQKEKRELLDLIAETEKMAKAFIDSVEEDPTLEIIKSNTSMSAKEKRKALDQVKRIQTKLLPEMTTLKNKYQK